MFARRHIGRLTYHLYKGNHVLRKCPHLPTAKQAVSKDKSNKGKTPFVIKRTSSPLRRRSSSRKLDNLIKVVRELTAHVAKKERKKSPFKATKPR